MAKLKAELASILWLTLNIQCRYSWDQGQNLRSHKKKVRIKFMDRNKDGFPQTSVRSSNFMASLKTFMLCLQTEERGSGMPHLHKIARYSARVASRKGDAAKTAGASVPGGQFNRHYELWANWARNWAKSWAKYSTTGHCKVRYVLKLQK